MGDLNRSVCFKQHTLKNYSKYSNCIAMKSNSINDFSIGFACFFFLTYLVYKLIIFQVAVD